MRAHLTAMNERCFSVVGTAWTGDRYCGYPAKSIDANGRPVCGVHKKGNHGILWYGIRYRYPEGTQGRWTFAHGPERKAGLPPAYFGRCETCNGLHSDCGPA